MILYSLAMADVRSTFTLHTMTLPAYLLASVIWSVPASDGEDSDWKIGPHYSTFNTSFIAFFSVSFGKAPIAICGLSFSGTKSMLGML